MGNAGHVCTLPWLLQAQRRLSLGSSLEPHLERLWASMQPMQLQGSGMVVAGKCRAWGCMAWGCTK